MKAPTTWDWWEATVQYSCFPSIPSGWCFHFLQTNWKMIPKDFHLCHLLQQGRHPRCLRRMPEILSRFWMIIPLKGNSAGNLYGTEVKLQATVELKPSFQSIAIHWCYCSICSQDLLFLRVWWFSHARGSTWNSYGLWLIPRSQVFTSQVESMAFHGSTAQPWPPGFAKTCISALLYTCAAGAVGALLSEVRRVAELNERVDPLLQAQDGTMVTMGRWATCGLSKNDVPSEPTALSPLSMKIALFVHSIFGYTPFWDKPIICLWAGFFWLEIT